uniref:N.vectensis toxin 6 n=2 Tax=Nematostella vectensis TaxID=45351 RepID=NV6_NEMVE|nr:RecName: Full=N.vectensis toxin 6; Short=Nv6; Flags: Precursor [Nematostella vectensis]
MISFKTVIVCLFLWVVIIGARHRPVKLDDEIFRDYHIDIDPSKSSCRCDDDGAEGSGTVWYGNCPSGWAMCTSSHYSAFAECCKQ